MTGERRVDLLREVLDHEVVDSAGESCGMVDDIELEETGHGLEVVAILLGPGSWGRRLPALVELLARLVFGSSVTRIPWRHVERITEVIQLDARGSQLGLGRIDRRIGRWLSHLPAS